MEDIIPGSMSDSFSHKNNIDLDESILDAIHNLQNCIGTYCWRHVSPAISRIVVDHSHENQDSRLSPLPLSFIPEDQLYILSCIHIHRDKILGKGRYALVYLALFEKHEVNEKTESLAAKVTPVGSLDIRAQLGAWVSLVVMSSVNHPNIMKCYGHEIHQINDNPAEMRVYLPLCDGTLRDVIYDTEKSSVLSVPAVMKIAHGVAKGIAHLHHNGIAHHDIKSQNVLFLKENDFDSIIVGDFGLSELCDEKFAGMRPPMERSERPGSTYWKAPERFSNAPAPSPECYLKSDVWSYGCLLIELVTHCRPYPDIQFPWDLEEVLKKLDGPFNHIPPNIATQPNFSFLLGLIQKCCEFDVESRLSMWQVVEKFESAC